MLCGVVQTRAVLRSPLDIPQSMMAVRGMYMGVQSEGNWKDGQGPNRRT